MVVGECSLIGEKMKKLSKDGKVSIVFIRYLIRITAVTIQDNIQSYSRTDLNAKREALMDVARRSSPTYDMELFPLLSLSLEETTVNIQKCSFTGFETYPFYGCNANIQ